VGEDYSVKGPFRNNSLPKICIFEIIGIDCAGLFKLINKWLKGFEMNGLK
jgi:hypothetical protein